MMVLPLCLILFVTLIQGAPMNDDNMMWETWDLTHPFGKNTIYWPTAEPNFFNLTLSFEGMYGKTWVSMNKYRAEEHGGTHLDAPLHMNQKGKSVDQISVKDLTGPAVLIDIEEKAKRRRDSQVELVDVKNWEKHHGRIPEGAFVIMYSGWAHKWGNKTDYLGTNKTGSAGAADLKFPGFHPEAALFLINEREIRAVGVDTPSLDMEPDKTGFLTHRVLFSKNKFGLENLKIVRKWPKGTMMTAMPLLIEKGTGAPCRVSVTVPHCKRDEVWTICKASRPASVFLTYILLSILVKYFV